MSDPLQEEDKELKAILEMDLDGLDTLGSDDSSFKPAEKAPPMTLEKRMASSTRLARLQAMWDKGEPGDNPAGLPFSKGVEQMATAERSLTYKATLLKTYDTAVIQAKEIYDLVCLGEVVNMSQVRNVVNPFMDIMEKDRNVLLAICFHHTTSLADYLNRHAVNMSLVSLAAATSAGFSKGQVLEMGQAALLADVGMTMVPEGIRLKAGKLTEEELGEIHKHTASSFGLLEKIQGVSDIVLSAAYQHHERLISQAARIVAIADTLCAMVHKRSHRDALSPYAALDKVAKMGQMNFLDANLIKSLLRYLSAYHIGTFVELASGRMGRVVEANAADITRPVISVLRNAAGQPLPMKQILQVDLLKEKNERINKVLEAEAAKFKPLDGF
jgi:HD-GYP domain-containing protein (c-di-GMP phosphodiesterase class II)